MKSMIRGVEGRGAGGTRGCWESGGEGLVGGIASKGAGQGIKVGVHVVYDWIL